MNKSELIDAISQAKNLESNKKTIGAILDLFMQTVQKAVKKGDDVSLVGFGTFTKVKRKARNGVNPATGEKIAIKARTSPKFKPSSAFKDSLN
jgi:DNA-binding protein HU-beta